MELFPIPDRNKVFNQLLEFTNSSYFVRHIIIPRIAVTVEPGIYLPEFGVRSEIDVYILESGPRVTTLAQRSVVLI